MTVFIFSFAKWGRMATQECVFGIMDSKSSRWKLGREWLYDIQTDMQTLQENARERKCWQNCTKSIQHLRIISTCQCCGRICFHCLHELKMHQIHFRPGLHHVPHCGNLRRSPDPVSGWDNHPLVVVFGVSTSAQ